jgi:hypothetical protein
VLLATLRATGHALDALAQRLALVRKADPDALRRVLKQVVRDERFLQGITLPKKDEDEAGR